MSAVTFSLGSNFAPPDAKAQEAHIGHPPAFRHLMIDNYALRWPSSTASGNARLTWSMTQDRYDSPKAINCKSMSPMHPIAEQVGAEVLQSEVTAAFAAWQAVANVEFHFTSDWKSADILIGAQTLPTGVAYANVDFVAEKGKTHASIRKGLICLNPLRRWKNGFDGNLEILDVRYVVMHEIGHTLGLDHAGSRGQLMSFKYLEQFRVLQPGDIAGITAVYGSKRLANSRR